MNRRFAAVLLVAAIASGIAISQPGPATAPRPDSPNPPHGAQREAIMKDLNLSEQQRAQMEKLRTPFLKAQEQLQSNTGLNRLDLRDLLNAEKLDRSAIEKNMKATTDLQYQLKVHSLDHMLAVREILTPEQQKIWKKHMARMADEWQGRGMEGRQGMGRGPRP